MAGSGAPRRTHARDGHVLAIDQGTTSTRAIVFDGAGRPVSSHQLEHRQVFPRAGWVEHDPLEIWGNTREAVAGALARADLTGRDLAACGIANQRETTVVWERATGRPIANAVVWQDTRTAGLCRQLAGDEGADRFRGRTGLPLSTYFSGPKLRWLLDSVDGARDAARRGELLFGTIDSWLLWQLTGGVDGGLHLTDVTNASRTLLMDLETCAWDEDLAAELDVPPAMLPEIRSCAEVYARGRENGLLAGVPISGVLGDQQAAMFGQTCFGVGEAKSTYGTGNFVLLNTGTQRVASEHGLLTTVCYRLGDDAPVYALEGSIAVTGALVQWLRDNLGLIGSAAEVESRARAVEDNGGVYVVPAFSGLFAPRWRADARGVIVGLTRYANAGHLCRAALEATAFQTREVLEAMLADPAGVGTGAIEGLGELRGLRELRVDGGMVANELLLQFQADLLDVPVVRPVVAETTALGAAYAAGLAVGFWSALDDLRAHWVEDRRFQPGRDDAWREREYASWQRAVERSLDWAQAEAEAGAP